MRLTMDFSPVGVPYAYSSHADPFPSYFADERLEQGGTARGTLVVDGRQIAFATSTGLALMEAAGTPRFAALMLSAAQAIDAVDEIFAYRVADGAAPCAIFSSSELGDFATRSISYARHFHVYDPAIRMRRALPPGSGFATRVAATQAPPATRATSSSVKLPATAAAALATT